MHVLDHPVEGSRLQRKASIRAISEGSADPEKRRPVLQARASERMGAVSAVKARSNAVGLHGVISRREAQGPLWRHLHTRHL